MPADKYINKIRQHYISNFPSPFFSFPPRRVRERDDRRTAYKKALSVLSQAVVLNIALDDYDLSQVETDTTDGTSASMYNLFNNRMNVAEVCGGEADACDTGWSASWTSDEGVASTAEFGSSASANYTFFFNDGIVFSFPAVAEGCTEDEFVFKDGKCAGVIDVNGRKNPNKLIDDVDECTDDSSDCVPTDIYPVKFYDQSILPNSDGARTVLYGK